MLSQETVTAALATELMTYQPQSHEKCMLCKKSYSSGYETPPIQTQLSCREHFHRECILNHIVETERFNCPCCGQRLHIVSTSDSDADSIIARLRANDKSEPTESARPTTSSRPKKDPLSRALEKVIDRFEREGRDERYPAAGKSAFAFLQGQHEPFSDKQTFVTTLPINILEPHIRLMGELLPEYSKLKDAPYDEQQWDTWRGMLKAVFTVLKDFKQQNESWSETSLITYFPGAIKHLLHAKGHADVDELFASSVRGTSPIFGTTDAALLLEYVLVVCRDEFLLRRGETIKMAALQPAKRPGLMKRISSKFSRSHSREPLP